jgi:hypothetical protein
MNTTENTTEGPLQPTETRLFTFGEKAVGLNFNPSGNPEVQELKELYARIIDIHNDALKGETDGEKIRLRKIAITEAQGDQMWGVKAATWDTK